MNERMGSGGSSPGPILSITLLRCGSQCSMLTVCSENQDVVDKILEDYDISCIGKLNIDYTAAIEIDVETQDLNEKKLNNHLMMICHHIGVIVNVNIENI